MSQLIGQRFRILSELGQGAMGAVWRVADTLAGDRELALKRIRRDGALTPELRLRFKEEFRAMAKLRHPNLISVFDYGELDDAAQYLTMEIVPGQELAALIAKGPLPLEQVYSLLIQLLQALEFIHARLYVHRDVKAPNIRVTPDGVLKLMDFGLMTQLGASVPGGTISGTPAYLPPEAIQGGVIDAASDLYSVGCLAYEMITGRLPFEGPVMAVVRAHLRDTPERPRALRPEVPAALDAIVMRLLEKDRARRYAEASEVIGDLARLSGAEVTRESLAQKRSYLVSSALVGREPEMAALEAALDAALAGRGGAIYVGAPAGVGKSRLVQELLLQAKLRDATVLTAQCLETGLDPIKPIKEGLRPLMALTTPEEQRAHQSILQRFYPQGECVWVGPPPEAERAELLEDMLGWFAGLTARRPIVLAIEDLHWADPFTLELLNGMIPRLSELGLLLIGTLREDEAPAGGAVWYPVAEGHATLQRIAPFGAAQTGRLVSAMLRQTTLTPAFEELVYQATAGNAFFVTELLRYWMEQGVLVRRDGAWHAPAEIAALAVPASVEATLSRRLTQLSAEARQVAAVAAVMGRSLALEPLAALSGLDEEALFSALDELVARQFLAKRQRGYHFPHDRVRETLYAEVEPGLRQALHQRYAEHLEAAAAADVLGELAYHFGRGTDRRKAFEALVTLGDRAQAAGSLPMAVRAWSEAVTHLEAIEHPDREALLAELRVRIGVSGFQFAPREAIAALELAGPAIAALSPLSEEGRQRHATFLAALAGSYGFAGDPARSRATAEKLAPLMQLGGRVAEGAHKMLSCIAGFQEGRFDEVVALAAAAQVDMETEPDDDPGPMLRSALVAAPIFRCATAYQGIQPDPALRALALQRAEAHDQPELVAFVRHLFALWYGWTGDEAAAIAEVEAIAHANRQVGAPPSPYVLYLRPFILLQRGELDDALVLIRQALRYPHLEQTRMIGQLLQCLHGLVLSLLGQLDEAEAVLKHAEEQARACGLGFTWHQARLWRAKVHNEQGRHAEAKAVLLEVLRAAEAGPMRNPMHQAMTLQYLAEVAVAEGELGEARRRLEAALAIVTAPRQENLLLQGVFRMVLGQVNAGLRDRSAASASYEAASALFQRLRNRRMLHLVTTMQAALDGAVVEQIVPEAPPPAPWMHQANAAMLGW